MRQFRSSCIMAIAAAAVLALFAAPPGAAQVYPRVLAGPQIAAGSLAYDANGAGEIVGWIASLGDQHATLWKDGAYTFLDSPDDGVFDDCQVFEAQKINAKGQVIGIAVDASYRAHGFLWTPNTDNGTTGAMTDLGVSVEGDGQCYVVDINDSGQVIAESNDPQVYGNYHPFLWEKGTDNPIRTPLTWTDLTTSTEYTIQIHNGSLNNSGQVSGTVSKSDGTCPAVLWKDGAAIELTPGANASKTILNSSGAVAGDTESSGVNPWVYVPATGLRPIDLLTAHADLAGADLRVWGFNDQGQVLITARIGDSVARFFLWTDDGEDGSFQEIPLGTFELLSIVDVLGYLNNKGQVAGSIHTGYETASFFWDPSAPDTLQQLAPLPSCDTAVPQAITDATLIAGCSTPNESNNRAVTWDPTAPANRPPVLTVPGSVQVKLGFSVNFTATATDPDPNETLTFLMAGPTGATINPVTGAFSWFPDATGTFRCDVYVIDSGELWDTGTVNVYVTEPVCQPVPTDLGVLEGYTNSNAMAVNASGQIVGNLWSDTALSRAYIWLPADTAYLAAGMHEIPLPDGYTISDVSDINASGQVVGTVFVGTGLPSDWGAKSIFLWLPTDAYGLSAGTHVLTGIEGSTNNWFCDINDAGQVVFNSADTDGLDHGYIWQNGVATPLTRNGDTDPTPVIALATHGKCLNEAGQVAGMYFATNGGESWSQPVLWHDGVAIDVADPAVSSYPAAINEKGEIVGQIENGVDGYLYLPQDAYGLTAGSHRLHADLQYPDEGSSRSVFDINDAGRIIGRTSPGHSTTGTIWVWENGTFRDVAPLNDDVENIAENASGQAVCSTFTRGYFLSDEAGLLALTGLGGSWTDVHDINDASLAVGTASIAGDGATHACVWDFTLPNRPPELSVPAFVIGTVGTEITFIATATDPDRNHLTFTLLDAPVEASISETGDFSWTPDATGIFDVVVQVADSEGAADIATVRLSVWPAGGQYSPTDLGVLDGFTNSGAMDINVHGVVVGDLFNEGSDPVYGDQVPTDVRAFVWQDGVMTKLPLLDNYTHSRAYAINTSGQIAGECDTVGFSGGYPQACLWEYDTGNAVWTVRGLGFRPGHNASTVSWPVRKPLNDQGQVACLSFYRDAEGAMTDLRGFLWQNDEVTVLEDANVTPAEPIVPIAINNGGQVIGTAAHVAPDLEVDYTAVLWDSTGVTYLTPDQFSEPKAINNLGQIVGECQLHTPMIWLPEAIGQPGDYDYWPAGLSLFPEMYDSTLETINDAEQVLIRNQHWENDQRMNELAIGPLVGNFIWLGMLRFEEVNNPAMNASGQVTGTAETPLFDPVTWDYIGSILCGFYGSPRTGTEGNRLLLLGGLGGPRVGSNAINAGGTMAGYSSVPGDAAIHACVWTAPPPTPQPPSLLVPNQISAVVGTPVTFTVTATDPDGDALTFGLGPDAPAGAAIDPTTGVFTWTPDYDSLVNIPVLVTDGTFTTSGNVSIIVYPAGTPLPVNLGVLPGFQNSYATGINPSGTVIGSCYNEESDGEVSYRTAERAFVWQAGTMTELLPPDDYSCSHANAINTLGQIVGYCSSSPGIYDNLAQACLWEYTGGAWQRTDLGFLDGREPAHVGSQAVLINDSGLITGESWYKPGEGRESFFWQAGTPLPVQAFTGLPDNPGTNLPYKYLVVRALNNSGLIVGNATDDLMTWGPGVVWNANTHTTVKTLENSDLGAINTAGLVAGRYVPLDDYGSPAWKDQILFVWDSATDERTELGNPGSGNPYILECSVNPMAISDGGKILVFGLVTYDYDGDGVPDWEPTPTAWLYAEDRYTDLYQVLDNNTEWAAMSPTGKVAGYTAGRYAFFWDGTGYAMRLPGLGGMQTYAEALNAADQVAGAAATGTGYMRAVVWTVPETPEPPTLHVPVRAYGEVETLITFTASATDPNEGDTLTFSLTDAPYGAKIDPATGVFTWNCSTQGAYSATVQVSDGVYSDSRPVRIDVYPAGTTVPTSLGVLPGFDNSQAMDINASGVVVGDCFNGYRWMEEQDWDWVYSDRRAFVWQNSQMTALPLLPDYPYSHAQAINAQGQIVGYCSTSLDYNEHPKACLWEYDTGNSIWTVTPLEWLTGGDPAHNASAAADINAQGLIIGKSWTEDVWNDQWVIWRNGQAEAISNLPTDYPYLQVAAMGDNGTLIGFTGSQPPYYDGSGVAWKSTFPTETLFERPDAAPGAVNASGQVAGRITPAGELGFKQQYVFLWDPTNRDVFTNLGVPIPTVVPDPPDVDPLTYLYTTVFVEGMSDKGDILLWGSMNFGTAASGDNTVYYLDRIWVYANGQYTEVANNLTYQVDFAVMSPAGYVAGWYNSYAEVMLWDSFFWDGAGLARALPGLGGDDTRAAALNDRKQVVGASMTGDGHMRAVIWNANDPPILYVSSRYAGVVNTPVTFTALATDPNEGDTLTFSLSDAPDGAAINAATGVFTWTPTSEGTVTFEVSVTDQGGLSATKQVRIDVHPAGTQMPMDLGVLDGFEHSWASDINASGVVVGDLINGSRSLGEEVYDWNITDRQAFVWQDGQMTQLPRLEGYPYSHAEAINDQNQIVGWCEYDFVYRGDFPQACLWENTGSGWTVTGMGVLPGRDPEHDSSRAYSINATGLVVGVSYTEQTTNHEYFLWKSGEFVPFDGLPVDPDTGLPYPNLQVDGIGDNGTVIGHAIPAPGTASYSGPYVVWDANTRTILKELPFAQYGSVNASGQVVGQMLPEDADGYPIFEDQYIFLWDPATPDVVTNLGVPDATDPDYLFTDLGYFDLSDGGDFVCAAWINFDHDSDGYTDDYTFHTWVYTDGVYTELTGDLAGDIGMVDISPAGYVAGYYEEAFSDEIVHAFYWDGTGPAMVLPGLGGDETVAVALNDHKQVAGSSETASGARHAVVWRLGPVEFALNNVPATATIPEMEPYTFTATATHPDPSAVLTFSLTGAPEGAAIDPSSGVFTWTPSEAQGPDDYTFTVTVTDDATPPHSVSKTTTISVTEVNRTPVLADQGPRTIDELTQLLDTLEATDDDLPAQTLSYSLTSKPDGMTIDSATGSISWTPTEAQGPGSYEVTAEVSDGTATDTQTFTVTVNEVNQSPVLSVPTSISGTVGSVVTFLASATDSDIPANTLTFSLTGAPAGAGIDPVSGVFTWTPASAGSVTFDVNVSDVVGGSDTKPVTITVTGGATLTLSGVPASKTTDEMTLCAFTAVATSPYPNAKISYALAAGAPTGAAINARTGAFAWTPAEAQGPGTYTVTVTATDRINRLSASQDCVITVNEANRPPVLTVPASLSGTVGTLVTFTATATDPDIPANTLTFGPADNGFGGKIDPTTGVFTWTPTYAGTSYTNVTVSDGMGGTDSKSVTIVVTQGPVGGSLTVSDARVAPKNKTYVATFTLTNPTTQAATNVVLTTATLGGNPAFGATRIGNIQAGASIPVTLQFKNGLSGQVDLVIEGTCSLGTFARTQPIVLS